MSAIVIDTHTLIWYLNGSSKLSNIALDCIDQTSQAGDFVYVSSISLVEVAYLAERERLPEFSWQRLEDALTDVNVGITNAPVDAEIARALRHIPREIVPDMPDRIIAATALHLNLPLVTRDHKIQALTVIETIW